MHWSTDIYVQALIPGVIEFTMPAQPIAGLARYWVTYKSGSSPTQYSAVVHFAFLPADEEGAWLSNCCTALALTRTVCTHLICSHSPSLPSLYLHSLTLFALALFELTHSHLLTLAYVGRVCLSSKAIESDAEVKTLIPRFRLTTRDLDVSHCDLTRLDFLGGFTQLTTLILDHNKLTASARLPFLPLLHTLYINSNLITSAGLGSFLDNLAPSTPVRFITLSIYCTIAI